MATPRLRPSMPAPKPPTKVLQANTAKAALENRLSKQFAAPRLRPSPVAKLTPVNLRAAPKTVPQPAPPIPMSIAQPMAGPQLPPPAALGVASIPSPAATASNGTADIGLTTADKERVQSLFLANLSMNLSAIDGIPANAAATAQQFHLTTKFAEAFEQLVQDTGPRPITSLREARTADQTKIFQLMQDITTLKNSPGASASQFDGLIRR